MKDFNYTLQCIFLTCTSPPPHSAPHAMEPADLPADPRGSSSSGLANHVTEPTATHRPTECPADQGGRFPGSKLGSKRVKLEIPEESPREGVASTLNQPARRAAGSVVQPPSQIGESSTPSMEGATLPMNTRQRRSNGGAGGRPKKAVRKPRGYELEIDAGDIGLPGVPVPAIPAGRPPRESEHVLVFPESFVPLVLNGRKTLDIRPMQIKSGNYWISHASVIVGRALITFRERIDTKQRWIDLIPEHCWGCQERPYRLNCAFTITNVEQLIPPVPHKPFKGVSGLFAMPVAYEPPARQD